MTRAVTTTLGAVTMLVVSSIVACGLFVSEQRPIAPTTPDESNFNLIFKYGVGAWNELNTFEGTYTKDMVVDPSIAVNLSLSNDELGRIYQKMIEIDFLNYPDRFSVFVPLGGAVVNMTPHSSYYFRVEYDSKVKELWWNDGIINRDEKAEKLRELIRLIIDIIESKEEYKKLPSPRGGYI